MPAAPRRYERTVTNAQEAHEAIRPAGDVFRTPAEVARELTRDELALYDLIFKRTIASQMKDARRPDRLDRARRDDGRRRATPTFRRERHRDHVPAASCSRTSRAATSRPRRTRSGACPRSRSGRSSRRRSSRPQGHETSPPSRYTEASLVKALEDRGIGRPSTYASIMGTILDRGYVFKKGTALVPTFLAFAVTQLLERHFDRLVDYDFTARLEDDLDRIAAGDEERVDWLKRFYFGRRRPGPALARHRPPRGDRRPRGQLDRDPRLGHRRPRRPVRPVPASAATSARACPRTSRPTS